MHRVKVLTMQSVQLSEGHWTTGKSKRNIVYTKLFKIWWGSQNQSRHCVGLHCWHLFAKVGSFFSDNFCPKKLVALGYKVNWRWLQMSPMREICITYYSKGLPIPAVYSMGLPIPVIFNKETFNPCHRWQNFPAACNTCPIPATCISRYTQSPYRANGNLPQRPLQAKTVKISK